MHYIKFQFPNIDKVHCAFQVRSIFDDSNPLAGGNISYEVGDDFDKVLINRLNIKSILKVDSFSDVKQVHGIKTIFEPDNSDPYIFPTLEADGLATTKSKHALCIKTADCQPILICDNKGEHLLALHSGWRGNRQKYPIHAVKEFCSYYGLEAKNLCAVRGPSLSPSISEFINYSSEWGEEFNTWYNEKNKTVNLWELTKAQLQQAGIIKENIFGIDICTYSNPQFFSYRRQKICGRQGSFIWKE